jgi:hypothetical protein
MSLSKAQVGNLQFLCPVVVKNLPTALMRKNLPAALKRTNLLKKLVLQIRQQTLLLVVKRKTLSSTARSSPTRKCWKGRTGFCPSLYFFASITTANEIGHKLCWTTTSLRL